jgi:hypothetical protein
MKTKGGNSIKAGLSLSRNIFEVDHDSLPKGMVQLKRNHKAKNIEQVSRRLNELESTFREREDVIQ